MSLTSTNSTPSSLIVNTNPNGLLHEQLANHSSGSGPANGTTTPSILAARINMDNQPMNKNGGLLSIQSTNSLISSSVSSLSSSSSSHSASLSQEELQFNEFNSNQHPKHHHSHHPHHHNHNHHHHHHHHPYLNQHHLTHQQQQQQQNQFNQEYPPIQLSLHHFNTLKSLNDYQQKVEYLLKLTPMPSGWQKSQTDNGEIFFINHATRSTCWDPRLKIIEIFLQKHDSTPSHDIQQHQQQHQHQHQQQQHEYGLQAVSNSAQNMMPMYQHQMNSRSNSTGAVSSSSCASSNSVSPLFMLNSSGNVNNNSILNSNGDLLVEDQHHHHQQQQQQIEFSRIINDGTNGPDPHQERINSLIEIITKKKELLKSLNELNKKESYLRSQLDNFNGMAANADSSFIKLEEVDIESKNVNRDETEQEEAEDDDDDDDEDENQEEDDNLSVDLSNPEMTFISSSDAASENLIDATKSDVNILKLNNKRPKFDHINDSTAAAASVTIGNEAELDAVNSMYNKLLIHNNSNGNKTNKNYSSNLTDENNTLLNGNEANKPLNQIDSMNNNNNNASNAENGGIATNFKVKYTKE